MAKRAYQWGPSQKFTPDRSSFTYAVRSAREMLESEDENVSTRFDRNFNVVVGFRKGIPFLRILIVDLRKLEKGTLTDWSKIDFDVVHVANASDVGVKELTPKGFEELRKVLPGQQHLEGVLDGVQKIQKAQKDAREAKEKKRKETIAARTKKSTSD